MSFLADQVDAAARRATTADGGVRALADFDGLNGKDFTALRAGVAHAVQVGIALGVETTDERTVALGVTAFTGTEGDAWHGAQRILHVQGARVLEDLLRDHGHRTRGIDQRRGVLGRRGFFYLVGRRVLGFTGHAGGIQSNRIARCFLVSLLGRENHLACGAGGDRHANGRSE
ncbi:hypothetical protein D3C85_713800 [compost metagenome]